MGSEVPAWYYEAIKAIQWLEQLREKGDDTYYSPAAIAFGSKVQLDVVKQMIENSAEMLEVKGKRIRFNVGWRIQSSLDEAVASGTMRKTADGRYTLTKAGEQYARHLIMTSPEAQNTIRQLKKHDK